MLSFTQARQQLLHNDLISAVTTVSLTVLVLLLALLGIYGTLSYQIQLRRHELGIRLAIGAAPSQLWQQLSRAQLTAVAAGAAIGLSLLMLQQWLRLAVVNPTGLLQKNWQSGLHEVPAPAQNRQRQRQPAGVEPV